MDNTYFFKLAKRVIVPPGSKIIGAYGTWVCDHGDMTDPKGDVVLIWHLENLEMVDRYGSIPYVRTKFSPRGFVYSFYEPEQRRPRSSGLAPMTFSGDLQQDFQRYIETVDSFLQIIEDPAYSPFFSQFEPQEAGFHSPKPERVPLSQVFKTKDEPSEEPVIPEEPPTAPRKTWRDSDDEREIIRLFPFRPKADDVQDLYQKAKQMKSNRLMNLAKQASQRIESQISREAQALVKFAKQQALEHCGTCASDVPRLKKMLAKQTDSKAKGHLAALLAKAQQAESLTECSKKRIVLFRPCIECKQEEGKIDECKRCHGCGIDPEFQVRIFEDPRNPLNEIIPPRRLPVVGG